MINRVQKYEYNFNFDADSIFDFFLIASKFLFTFAGNFF